MNPDYRQREYLSEPEVNRVMSAASRVGRHGLRDATLILIAYRHGLRVSELVALRWDQVDLSQGLIHVTRRKQGLPSVHPLRGPELRALRRLQRDYPETPYVFVSERKAPLTPDAVRKIVIRAGQRAGITFPIHPQMLRHATGLRVCYRRYSGKGARIFKARLSIWPRSASILREMAGMGLIWTGDGHRVSRQIQTASIGY